MYKMDRRNTKIYIETSGQMVNPSKHVQRRKRENIGKDRGIRRRPKKSERERWEREIESR